MNNKINQLRKDNVINAICSWHKSKSIHQLVEAVRVAELAIDNGASTWRALLRAHEHLDRLAVDRFENYRQSEMLRRNLQRLRKYQQNLIKIGRHD